MQLYISPSLRHIMVLPGKGATVRKLIDIRFGSRKFSCTVLLYVLVFFTFLLWFLFALMAVDDMDGGRKCSLPGCLGKRIRPSTLGGSLKSTVPEVIYSVFEQPLREDELQGLSEVPESLEEFMAEVKDERSDARTFALRLRAMLLQMEQRTQTARIHEYLYRHIASTSIPKQLHCLALRLTAERMTNAAARAQVPSPEFVPALVDNSYFHFVLASDNVLAASVVATSLIKNTLQPQKIVLHVITDKKTHSPMQAWFSLHPLSPAVVEVKALHQFDWFSKGMVPVLEAMEKDMLGVRTQFGRESSETSANKNTAMPHEILRRLLALGPKYDPMMNHIRIHLPELFPSLKKVVFLDDDTVVQTDLSPLWDIDMNGKVNGAVQTCKGDDTVLTSKRFKNYLNFSNPLVAMNFDPEECAWAYGMNVFDLEEWRKTNISIAYHYWLEQNSKQNHSLWRMGNLPPSLMAFRGHVHSIDRFWHMLGLGYLENTSLADAQRAGVVHFSGRAKPWLDIAIHKFRPLWLKYVDFSDKFIKNCRITPA